MVRLLLFLSALIALTDTLTTPVSPRVRSARSKKPPPHLPALNLLPFSHLSSSNTPTLLPISRANANTNTNANATTPFPTSLGTWPPLPVTSDTGHNLRITITQLGRVTSSTRRGEILNAISDLHSVVITEGDPYESIRGVYARSSGTVWTIFRCEFEVAIKRFQVGQVLLQVWLLMIDYGLREVVRSEIISAEGKGLAGFVLRWGSEVGE